MTDETRFFLFLIERYAEAKGCLAGDVIQDLDGKGITQEVYDGYEMYHQERLENAFMDIDALLATGKHAW